MAHSPTPRRYVVFIGRACGVTAAGPAVLHVALPSTATHSFSRYSHDVAHRWKQVRERFIPDFNQLDKARERLAPMPKFLYQHANRVRHWEELDAVKRHQTVDLFGGEKKPRRAVPKRGKKVKRKPLGGLGSVTLSPVQALYQQQRTQARRKFLAARRKAKAAEKAKREKKMAVRQRRASIQAALASAVDDLEAEHRRRDRRRSTVLLSMSAVGEAVAAAAATQAEQHDTDDGGNGGSDSSDDTEDDGASGSESGSNDEASGTGAGGTAAENQASSTVSAAEEGKDTTDDTSSDQGASPPPKVSITAPRRRSRVLPAKLTAQAGGGEALDAAPPDVPAGRDKRWRRLSTVGRPGGLDPLTIKAMTSQATQRGARTPTRRTRKSFSTSLGGSVSRRASGASSVSRRRPGTSRTVSTTGGASVMSSLTRASTPWQEAQQRPLANAPVAMEHCPDKPTELEVMRSVLLREAHVQRLRSVVEASRARRVDVHDVFAILDLVRAATLATFEAIARWRRVLVRCWRFGCHRVCASQLRVDVIVVIVVVCVGATGEQAHAIPVEWHQLHAENDVRLGFSRRKPAALPPTRHSLEAHPQHTPSATAPTIRQRA